MLFPLSVGHGAREAVACRGDDDVMRNGRAVDRENPPGSMGVRARNHDRDPISGSHQSQRHLPHKQAGHMTCTRPHAPRQIPLAIRASSTDDPDVWTGCYLPLAVAGPRQGPRDCLSHGQTRQATDSKVTKSSTRGLRSNLESLEAIGARSSISATPRTVER